MKSLNTKQRRRVQISFKKTESLTEKSAKDECCILNIVSRYAKTGMITHLNKYEGAYQDQIDSIDYLEAHRRLAEANSMFESLPAELRAKFVNKPENFLEFINNPKNKDEMEKLGFGTSHLEKLKKDKKPPKATETPQSDKNQKDIEDVINDSKTPENGKGKE